MDAFNQDLIAFIDTLPEKRNIIAVTAPSFGSSSAANSSFIRVNLVEAELRDKSQQELADEMAALAKKYNFARTFVSQEQTIGGDRRAGLPVQYVIQAPDFEQLRAAIPVFTAQAPRPAQRTRSRRPSNRSPSPAPVRAWNRAHARLR